MTEPQLKIDKIKVKQIVDNYHTGHVVIPEFQRDYVWQKNKAPKLIDSLYRGYPISFFLLWESTAESATPRKKNPRPRGGIVSWLIDGQQRVTTLAMIMYDEGRDVLFHPETDKFSLSNAATRNDPNWVRVADLWDEPRYREIQKQLFEGGRNANKRLEKFDKVRAILNYEVPLVTMIDYSFNDAVAAFTRTNTLGVRLKSEDIESAQIAAKHTGFIAEEVVPFIKELGSQGYKRISIMHLFRACAFLAVPDGRTRTPLQELNRNELQRAWKETKRATEQAIGLVRSELGLVNMNILWSGALLVPLIVLCANTPARELKPSALVAWLALASLLHRYSGSSDTVLDMDLRACRKDDPIAALLKNLRDKRSSIWAEPRDFAGTLKDKGGLLAMYIACKHRGILDFFTGGKLVLQQEVDRHHILPRGQFDEKLRHLADNVANIAFVGSPVNKSINLTGPEIYLKKLPPKILESQCVPTDPNLWSIDQAEQFWKARRILLAESFNEFLAEALPGRKLAT